MFCGNAPVDAQRVIEDGDTSIGLWMIELIALILEDCCLREYGKTVGKALRDEELKAQLTIEH